MPLSEEKIHNALFYENNSLKNFCASKFLCIGNFNFLFCVFFAPKQLFEIFSPHKNILQNIFIFKRKFLLVVRAMKASVFVSLSEKSSVSLTKKAKTSMTFSNLEKTCLINIFVSSQPDSFSFRNVLCVDAFSGRAVYCRLFCISETIFFHR